MPTNHTGYSIENFSSYTQMYHSLCQTPATCIGASLQFLCLKKKTKNSHLEKALVDSILLIWLKRSWFWWRTPSAGSSQASFPTQCCRSKWRDNIWVLLAGIQGTPQFPETPPETFTSNKGGMVQQMELPKH